mgnify:CR=1 FL=1
MICPQKRRNMLWKDIKRGYTKKQRERDINIYIYKPRGDKQILKDTKREKIEIKRVRAIKRDRMYRGKNKYMCQETGYAAVVEWLTDSGKDTQFHRVALSYTKI